MTPEFDDLDQLQSEYPHLEFIPCEEVEFTPAPELTKAYDLTVQNHMTFTMGDGLFVYDTMSVFAPMSNESQEEAKKLMTPYTNSSLNAVNMELSKEMMTGVFTMTSMDNANSAVFLSYPDEARKMNPGDRVVINMRGTQIRSTAGRVVFNSCLPEHMAFIDVPIDKKMMKKVSEALINAGDTQGFTTAIDELMRVGFLYSTLYPKSISLDMLVIPENIKKLKRKLEVEKDLLKQQALIDQMTVELAEHFKNNVPDLYYQIKSGAAKGDDQIRQVMVAKGLIADSQGNILPPIAKGVNEGYTPEEYFNASIGSRAGIADGAIYTGVGGYAYRKMIYVMASIEGDINNLDCYTPKTLAVKLDKGLLSKLKGRYMIDPDTKKLVRVSEEYLGRLVGLRSPVYCKSTKICRTCYGDLMKQIGTPYIGIVAAQEAASLSEKIMKCSDGLVHSNGNLVPFIDLFDVYPGEVKFYDKLQLKDGLSTVMGKDGDVSTDQIERHPPTDSVYMITTRNGFSLIAQGNHPLWVNTGIVSHLPCRDVELRGDNQYLLFDPETDTYATKTIVPDIEPIEMQLSYLVENHYNIWVDNRIATSNINDVKPNICGYALGYMFGAYSIQSEMINWKNLGESQFDKQIFSADNTQYFEGDHFIKRNKESFMADFYNELPKYCLQDKATNLRLPSDFINYDKDWLASFLKGIIYSRPMKGYKPATTAKSVRIAISSYYLAQQIVAICHKLRLKCEITPDNRSSSKDKYSKFVLQIARYPISIGLDFLQPVEMPYASYGGTLIGWDTITKITQLPNWNELVYDVRTETSEYMLSMVQNHNTFHTGGMASVEKPDIIKELMRALDGKMEPELRQLCKQDELNLISTAELCTVEINTNIFNHEKIIEGTESITLPVANFILTLDAIRMSVSLDRLVILPVKHREDSADGHILLTFSRGDIIFTTNSYVESPKEKAGKFDKLASGYSPWSTPEQLFYKIYDTIMPLVGCDSVHIETIIANILRWKPNPQIPARLKEPYDPIVFSVKTLPGVISWPLGMAFENFSKSVSVGMISQRGTESAVERVLFGDQLTEKTRRS